VAATNGATAWPGSSVPRDEYSQTMTITTYTNVPHGFGLTYDDARLSCIDDPSDPRLAATWSHRIGNEIAASVLFTLPGCTADEIAAGTAFSVLITTDSAASGSHLLGTWDWDAVTLEEAPRFLEDTNAAYLDAYHLHWRGFPILQLTARPSPEAPAPRILEELGLLYTPQQTFSSLVVWPTDDPKELRPTARELWDGFFLLPLEREGHVRTGHKLVRHLRISLTDEDLLVFAG
jgi:hypothetical protein